LFFEIVYWLLSINFEFKNSLCGSTDINILLLYKELGDTGLFEFKITSKFIN